MSMYHYIIYIHTLDTAFAGEVNETNCQNTHWSCSILNFERFGQVPYASDIYVQSALFARNREAHTCSA